MDRGGRGKISVVVVVCVGVCAVCWCIHARQLSKTQTNPNSFASLGVEQLQSRGFPSHPIPKDTGHRACPLCGGNQGQVYSRPGCGLGRGPVEEARRTGSCGGLVWVGERRTRWLNGNNGDPVTHPVTKNCGCAGVVPLASYSQGLRAWC